MNAERFTATAAGIAVGLLIGRTLVVAAMRARFNRLPWYKKALILIATKLP